VKINVAVLTIPAVTWSAARRGGRRPRELGRRL